MAAWTPIGDASDARGFEALIVEYLAWREVLGVSAQTRKSLEAALRGFGRWCEERGVTKPGDVSRSMVERYQRALFHYRKESGQPLSLRTQSNRLAHLKAFYRWLAKQRYLLYNPTSELELPKKQHTLPVAGFSVEEMGEILAVPDLATPLGLRDRAILETLYSTGIRRAELVKLDLYDLEFERGCLVVRQGKGGRDRVVPIGERALAWVRKYLEEARPSLVSTAEEWALFVHAEGGRLDIDNLSKRVKAILRQAGVRPRFGACHLFRHTMATQMLEGGADVRYVQEMLGHASLETTQIYTRVSIQALKAVHAATHPAALLERRADLRADLADELAQEITEEK